MLRTFIVCTAVMLLLGACAPVLSTRTREQVDRNITFTQLKSDPDSYRGRTVLLGGRIIQTVVESSESWVEVLEQPLGWGNRPEDTDETGGRFLIRFIEAPDPAKYAPGTEITVSGPVEGSKSLPLGQTRYLYPVIGHMESHLWSNQDHSPPRFMFGFEIGTQIH